MKLEMLAAKNGDCLILHCGTPTAPAIVLIDGGPAGVWDESLKPRLMEIRTERGLGDNQALTIDLVVISHVDDDHINGVTKLLQSIHDAKIAHELPLFHIDRLWHNSFDNILGNDETSKVMAQQFGAASTGSGFDDALHDHEAGSKRDAAFVRAAGAGSYGDV